MFLCFNGSSVQALESNFDDGYFGKNRRAPHTNLSRSEFLVGFYIIFFLRWGWWGWLAGWLVGRLVVVKKRRAAFSCLWHSPAFHPTFWALLPLFAVGRRSHAHSTRPGASNWSSRAPCAARSFAVKQLDDFPFFFWGSSCFCFFLC